MNPVPAFEQSFSAMLGSRYAIAVNSGTSALHAALEALDVRGREVIMPALCPAMDAFAIINAGGIPVFADVDERTHVITEDTVNAVLSDRTGAVITVSLHGLATIAPWPGHGIPIIKDCAQSLGASCYGRPSGTGAQFGCFSFEKKKHMTTGSEGGMIVSDNPLLAERARKFAGIGYKHMTAEAGRTSLDASVFQRPDYERFDTIGLNYRMSEQQAAIGLIALEKLGETVARRQLIAGLWHEAVKGKSLLIPQFTPGNCIHSYYSVAMEFDGDLDAWLRFYRLFCEKGGDGFYAMPKVPYQEPALRNHPLIRATNCPIAERLQSRLLLLKTHYTDIKEAERQVSIFSDCLKNDGWWR